MAVEGVSWFWLEDEGFCIVESQHTEILYHGKFFYILNKHCIADTLMSRRRGSEVRHSWAGVERGSALGFSGAPGAAVGAESAAHPKPELPQCPAGVTVLR